MIKYLDPSYKDEIRQLYENSFPEDSQAFVNHYFNVYLDVENVIGQTIDGELVSMVHQNPYQMKWQDKLYEMPYIVAVATHSAHKRKGYMREMLKWMLNDQYKSGITLSLLMPIDSTYYDQFGYGFVQDMLSYKFKADGLELKVQSPPYKILGPDDSIELLNDYNRYKTQFNLSENRGMRALSNMIKEVQAEDGCVVVLPDAYVAYYNNDEVFVRECAYSSYEGLVNCLKYIVDIAGDKFVEWMAPVDSPLKHLIPHRKGNSRTLKPFMMVRVINVQQILEDMALMLGDSIIKVTDQQIFENNGTYAIRGSDVSRTDEKPDITIDVESLAQWLFAYESLENLAEIRESVTLHREVIYYPELPIKNFFNQYV